MKKLNKLLLASMIMGSTGSAQAAFTFYSDLGTWQADVASASHTVSSFTTNAANVSSATGVAITPLGTTYDPADPNGADENVTNGHRAERIDTGSNKNNIDLGKSSNFSFTDNGMTWDFTLSSQEENIYYNDIPAGKIDDATNGMAKVNAFTDALSIGKFNGTDPNSGSDDFENDDFTLEITGDQDLFGIGFWVINNKQNDTIDANNGGSAEWLEVFASSADNGGTLFDTGDGSALGLLDPLPGYTTGDYNTNFADMRFIGILSDTAFSWLEFNEDAGNNDIGIKDFYFAGDVSAVPLPAGFWLLASGLVALGRFSRKK